MVRFKTKLEDKQGRDIDRQGNSIQTILGKNIVKGGSRFEEAETIWVRKMEMAEKKGEDKNRHGDKIGQGVTLCAKAPLATRPMHEPNCVRGHDLHHSPQVHKVRGRDRARSSMTTVSATATTRATASLANAQSQRLAPRTP